MQKYGLRSLPTAFYPDKKSGVTLTTHRLEENIAFKGRRYTRDAVNQLNMICEFVPVHLIYGGTNDMLYVSMMYRRQPWRRIIDYIYPLHSERETQDSLINPQEGRNFASITRLEDVGHLVRPCFKNGYHCHFRLACAEPFQTGRTGGSYQISICNSGCPQSPECQRKIVK